MKTWYWALEVEKNEPIKSKKPPLKTIVLYNTRLTIILIMPIKKLVNANYGQRLCSKTKVWNQGVV